MGIAGIPLAGWLADASGTPNAFEYTVSAFFIAFAVWCFRARCEAIGTRPGIVIAAATRSTRSRPCVFVLANVFPLTTVGVVLTLATGVYTLVHGRAAVPGLAPREGVSRCRSSPLGDPGRV